jgi:hypothetical protein
MNLVPILDEKISLAALARMTARMAARRSRRENVEDLNAG